MTEPNTEISERQISANFFADTWPVDRLLIAYHTSIPPLDLSKTATQKESTHAITTPRRAPLPAVLQNCKQVKLQELVQCQDLRTNKPAHCHFYLIA